MRIAFIAHDEKKSALTEFVDEHANLLERFDCMATGSTGEQLNQETGLEVEQLESGSHGGDMMVGAAVAADECDAVIFLRDPLTAKPHEPDIMALLRVCDVHDVPFATNLSSADMMIEYLVD
jgi:methylglyoxal synthase